ncbi:MAG TPA: hypothetical protein VF210_11075 [Pseudomonadales bacterium]
MALNYHISADEGLITVQGEGGVRLGELTRLGRSLLADRSYDPRLPQLLDFRGLRPVKPGRLEELLEFVQETYRGSVESSVAVVIDEHLERRHAADIYLLTCALRDAELFCDYDQALKWLMRRAFAVPSAEQQQAGRHHAHSAPE